MTISLFSCRCFLLTLSSTIIIYALGKQKELFRSGALKLQCAWKSLGRLIRTHITRLYHRVCDTAAKGQDRGFTFLTSSQGMLLLWRPHLENHWFRSAPECTASYTRNLGQRGWLISSLTSSNEYYYSDFTHEEAEANKKSMACPRTCLPTNNECNRSGFSKHNWKVLQRIRLRASCNIQRVLPSFQLWELVKKKKTKKNNWWPRPEPTLQPDSWNPTINLHNPYSWLLDSAPQEVE